MGLGYWLLRQMILSPEQSGQTEIGLQPFQDHFAEFPKTIAYRQLTIP